MRFSEVSRPSDSKLDTKPTKKKRPANGMYNGDYNNGKLNQVTSESSPLHKKRREGGTSDSSAKFDWVPRKESGTQGHIASYTRIDGMRRKKEDIGRSIDMAGRVPARDRREYRLRSGWGNTESGSESEHESEGSGYVQGADTERETELEGQPVKLTSEQWDALDKKLSKLETAFNNVQNQDYDQESLINVITNEEVRTVDDVTKLALKELRKASSKFRKAVDDHYIAETCHPEDNEILMTIKRELGDNIPNHEVLSTIDSIRQQIENGKRGAED